MQYDALLATAAERGGLDRDHAEQAVTATLTVLGQRLAANEPNNLAAQLPGEVQGLLTQHAGEGEAFDVDEFLRRIAAQEGRGCTPDQAREHAHAVFSALTDAVSSGELDDVRAQLPAGYAPLLGR